LFLRLNFKLSAAVLSVGVAGVFFYGGGYHVCVVGVTFSEVFS